MVTFLQTCLKCVKLDRDTQAVHCLKIDCAAVHTDDFRISVCMSAPGMCQQLGVAGRQTLE